MVISARPAEEHDQAALRRLRTMGREEAREKKGGALFIDELDALHAGDPDSPSAAPPRTTLVGLIGEAAVGYAEVSRTGRVALVEELYCEPAARRVGLGDALVSAATDLATGWGCAYLDSVALPGDRETKNFFEAHGMVSRLLRVSREL